MLSWRACANKSKLDYGHVTNGLYKLSQKVLQVLTSVDKLKRK